ncbi:methionine ABC transporter ATP-binding protein [Caenibacillus caldisaponilyticus]|uniref:methionine ABC transporter ATP-binding protein n=1 Tax=Caenibacillus caldisaponilyticus TaxID=1674942 RepID=UPI000988706A|nr:methionine ABC transporter ATP-binding protein [Caenibacillus caldisaponilyticus]
MIVFQDVRKVYGKGKAKRVEALKGINLHVKKGEIFGVIGFSGAGKSTLLRCVNLLERPTSGKVIVDGVDLLSLSPKELRKQRKKIGMIFQHFNLLHSKTVFGNVAMPLIIEGRPKHEIEKKVNQLLSFVGLEDKANQYPEQLSGGQKQRVGIARALATDPHILLCDEATSALDPDTTRSVLNLLKKVRDELGITILMITHEMNVIRDACDRVAVLEDGVIVEEDTVLNVFTEPKTEIARNFVRTVLNDSVPPTVREWIQRSRSENSNRRLFRIIFKGAATNEPLLSNTAKRFPVDLNILHGTITEMQGIPFGNLLVDVTGDREAIEQAVQYMQSQEVIIKEVADDAI